MRLTDYFIEVIAYVAYFINTVTVKQTPFDQVKADIHRLLSESERHLEKGEFSQEDFDLARFAICAWIDETILSSSWDSKGHWQAE